MLLHIVKLAFRDESLGGMHEPVACLDTLLGECPVYFVTLVELVRCLVLVAVVVALNSGSGSSSTKMLYNTS